MSRARGARCDRAGHGGGSCLGATRPAAPRRAAPPCGCAGRVLRAAAAVWQPPPGRRGRGGCGWRGGRAGRVGDRKRHGRPLCRHAAMPPTEPPGARPTPHRRGALLSRHGRTRFPRRRRPFPPFEPRAFAAAQSRRCSRGRSMQACGGRPRGPLGWTGAGSRRERRRSRGSAGRGAFWRRRRRRRRRRPPPCHGGPSGGIFS